MKFSIVVLFLAGLVSGAFSKPSGLTLGYQDTLGQYSFGYSAPYQARSEVRSLDGVTRGSYSYVDGAGLVQSADYTADSDNGFRVVATNLPQAPVPVQDTPEVAAARAAHLLALEEAAKVVETPQEANDGAIITESAQLDPVDKDAAQSQSNETPAPAEPANDEPAKPEEPITVEAAPQTESQETPELKSAVDENGQIAKDGQSETQQQEKGRVGPGLAVAAPWIGSILTSLPVPLSPVNFDQPTISAYSGRSADVKDVQTLPQPTPTQGLIVPAGTTLKTATGIEHGEQVAHIAKKDEIANSASSGATISGREFTGYQSFPAVFTPISPFISLGYEPTIPAHLRNGPFQYITFNVV